MRSNFYTLAFTSAVTIILGFLLALASESLKERQEMNIELDKKNNILSALGFIQSESNPLTKKEIKILFEKSVKEINVDKNGNLVKNSNVKFENLTVYKKVINHKTEGYAIPISGKGLWSTLFGYLAVEPDGMTIKGITFYEHKETAGLGGEIEKSWFQNNFIGKRFIDKKGQLVSIEVIKGTVSEDDPEKIHKVDGISGATMTGRGLNKFLMEDLQKYEPFFMKIRDEVEI